MFEQKIKRLEEIVKKMEEGNLELEDSLKLFEEGVKLTKECQSHLQQAEQKVKILVGVDANGNPVLENFKSE
jgi:exodeoxyribonuclease VII small subunit